MGILRGTFFFFMLICGFIFTFVCGVNEFQARMTEEIQPKEVDYNVPPPQDPNLTHIYNRWLLKQKTERRASDGGSISPFPTNQFAVHLRVGIDPNIVADSMGMTNLGQIGAIRHNYVFERPMRSFKKFRQESLNNTFLDDDNSVMQELIDMPRYIPSLLENEKVISAEHLVLRQRFKRTPSKRDTLPTDPLFSNQWHLKNTGQGGGVSGIDCRVETVWTTKNIIGRNVVIAIVDDGVEHTHPDLSAGYKSAYSYDFNYNDADPAPGTDDNHGTSCAGCASAQKNTKCGVGSAYGSFFSGIRLISLGTTQAVEASALTYKMQNNFIYSNSWGPNDDGKSKEKLSTTVANGFNTGVTQGRGGKGCIYTWACGNGHLAGDMCNYDGYASSRYTIAVGGVDNKGRQSEISETCAALHITAPTAGASDTLGITTTDRTGTPGYSTGDCTSGFGGTSAACPIAAGVIALLLEAKPSLTYRDVNWLLAKHSRKIQPSGGTWVTNGAGISHSETFGFGMVDATAYINAAATWTAVPSLTTPYTSSVMTLNKAIPDNSATGTSASHTITKDIIAEHVEVAFKATHASRGQLVITLKSPSNIVSTFAKKHGDTNANYDLLFTTVRTWGENCKGTWTMTVADVVSGTTGTWNSWQITCRGTLPTAWGPTPTPSQFVVTPSPGPPTSSPTPSTKPTPTAPISYCAGLKTLTGNLGTITDGSGASNYKINMNCQWLIKPADTSVKSITLTFTSFKTEATYDTVKVYNGGGTSSPLLGTYSGSKSTFSVSSTGNQMYVTFTSDNIEVAAGFLANYVVVFIGATPSPDASKPTPTPTITPTPTSVSTDSGSKTDSTSLNLGALGLPEAEENAVWAVVGIVVALLVFCSAYFIIKKNKDGSPTSGRLWEDPIPFNNIQSGPTQGPPPKALSPKPVVSSQQPSYLPPQPTVAPPSMPPPTREPQVKATWDFDAQNADELSMRANEIFTVLSKDDAGWLKVRATNGRIGLVPENRCENIEATPFLPPKPKNLPQKPRKLLAKQSAVPTQSPVVAPPPFTPTQPQQPPSWQPSQVPVQAPPPYQTSYVPASQPPAFSPPQRQPPAKAIPAIPRSPPVKAVPAIPTSMPPPQQPGNVRVPSVFNQPPQQTNQDQISMFS